MANSRSCRWISSLIVLRFFFFFFQAEDGIRDPLVTGVQTCALPILVFNPSFPFRLTHMLLASAITVGFLLAGISAWQVLRGRSNTSTPKVLRVGIKIGRASCRERV